MLKVLVTYASKHHATTEIAEAIADVLQQSPDLIVTLAPAFVVHDLGDYDVVILGSAVYAGQWQAVATNLLKDYEAVLAQKQVWLFSSGPSGEGDAKTLLKGWTYPEALKPVVERIAPRDIAVFHGKIDPSTLGFGERAIIKMVKAPVGDFRDWEQIRAWANDIASALVSNTLKANP